MKNSRFTEAQIMAVLRQVEGGLSVLNCAVSTGSAARRFTNGGRSMGAWMPR